MDQSAQEYYNTNRKRSFLYSRLSVIVSMVVLVGVLGFNVNTLYNEQTSTQSQASTQPKTDNLPKLAKGCVYERTNDGFRVVCATPTPSPLIAKDTINVQLPQLPRECSLQAQANGSRVVCVTRVPIPTVQVQLPLNCTVSTQPNTASCTKNNQRVATPLPSLPGGCSYKQVGQNYFVVCSQ